MLYMHSSILWSYSDMFRLSVPHDHWEWADEVECTKVKLLIWTTVPPNHRCVVRLSLISIHIVRNKWDNILRSEILWTWMEHIEAQKVPQTDLMMWCWSQIESNYQLSQHWGSWRWFAQNTGKFEVPWRGDTAASHLVIIFGGSHFFPPFFPVFFRCKHRGLKKILVKPPDLRSETEVEEVCWEAMMVSVMGKWLFLMMLMEEILPQLGCIKPWK